MNLSNLGVDLYQLTTLIAHARLDRLGHSEAMAFFFRKLPGQRNYVVFAGLRQIVEWCQALRFEEADLAFLEDHPVLAPALARHPEILEVLREVSGFTGDIHALPEGTLAFAGPGKTTTGEPLRVQGSTLQLYTPLLQVRTSLVQAKLIETPWLTRINHLSMVASKAARVVWAAAGRPVLEFGQRRTHPDAAIDAAYAAHLAGCAATSNLAAEARYGIPARGTMDHFAVQASERPDVPPDVTEREFFRVFAKTFPEASVLLVDTYDTERGLRAAVRAAGTDLRGVRLDSNVNPESVRRARAILDEEGAPNAKIFVSDGLDEWRITELVAAGADGFGVGEQITCSPDSARGVSAVGKVVQNGYGKFTMKLASGSGKATLPGWLQVYRARDHDLVALTEEPPPARGVPLLQPVWTGDRLTDPLPTLAQARERVQAQIARLPDHLRGLATDHGRPWPLVASDRLVDLVRTLAKEGSR